MARLLLFTLISIIVLAQSGTVLYALLAPLLLAAARELYCGGGAGDAVVVLLTAVALLLVSVDASAAGVLLAGALSAGLCGERARR